ncbi:uncharacterized protein B0J16DRAFT_373745 [Fusarium flagelliforme]|uniref:uncharacterized protein n=1 Tax=Fusarium flagelliforme TaxID=2675880 RepID=UPI001E8CA72D|nr:uncharacterized protein B0J16DRAFT_373745 [Fusarium flagelliforme]KAH7183240.1 hypothetical protein B0J16DRAFT_373745 [Fusarium flagelliforme]
MSANFDNKVYDRWLKGAEVWIQEDDWSPDEYFKWTARLAEAKANLDETFLKVDNKLLDVSRKMVNDHYTPILKKYRTNTEWYIRPVDVAKIILRPIIAYHFYQRSTFEEIPEKTLVTRVQMHLSNLKIPMMDYDVPIEEAVHNYFRYYEEKIKRTDPVGLAYNYNGLRQDTYQLVSMLQSTRVNGGPVDRSKIGEIFKAIDEYQKSRGSYTHGEEKATKTMALFDTDEKMELFLERCQEPMVSHEPQDSNATAGIKYLVEEGEFKKLLDLAVAEEKKYCSWEATVGPAIKALRRLGRTSAGKDMNKLADYAKTHQKPQIA